MTHNVPSVFFHVTCCFPHIEQYCSSDMSISLYIAIPLVSYTYIRITVYIDFILGVFIYLCICRYSVFYISVYTYIRIYIFA